MRQIIILLIALLIQQDIKACDQCNVVLGSGAISEGHFIGYRLRYRRQFQNVDLGKSSIHSKHLEHFQANGEIKELYTAHELYGNYHIGKNWHLSLAIPFLNNYRSLNTTTVHDIYGIGDPWVMLRKQESWRKEKDHLFVSGGLGFKFPLGSTSAEDGDTYVDLDMQPGTGSMDYLANLVLLYEYRKVFVMSQNTGKLNGSSPDDFRYGNNLSTSLLLGSRVINKGEDAWRLSFTGGIYSEFIGRDEVNGEKKGDISSTYFMDGGAVLRFKSMIVTANGQIPFITKVDSRQLPTTHRFILNLQYEI
ncbi:MAG: hypothetical protein HKO93_04505 [Flavobacteriales bacterium]|nr:hypothetical protein [Flavobacteriales bacterium]